MLRYIGLLQKSMGRIFDIQGSALMLFFEHDGAVFDI